MTTATPKIAQIAVSTSLPKWQAATWEDYLRYRDEPTLERVRLFFKLIQLYQQIWMRRKNFMRIWEFQNIG